MGKCRLTLTRQNLGVARPAFSLVTGDGEPVAFRAGWQDIPRQVCIFAGGTFPLMKRSTIYVNNDEINVVLCLVSRV